MSLSAQRSGNGCSILCLVLFISHHVLQSKDGPINIAPYIHKGQNTAKFIQLVDLSGYMYTLYASRLVPVPQKALSNPWGDHLKFLSRGGMSPSTDMHSDNNGPFADVRQRFVKTKLDAVVSVTPGMLL